MVLSLTLRSVDAYISWIMWYHPNMQPTLEKMASSYGSLQPHQNGTVERAWRSMFEMARCLLWESQLPKSLWTYAVMFSAYVRNRFYISRISKTPFQVFTGQKPDISNMHTTGNVCYAYVQNKNKLDPEGIFVGYDRGSRAYVVYSCESQSVRRVRCVKFPKMLRVLEVIMVMVLS